MNAAVFRTAETMLLALRWIFHKNVTGPPPVFTQLMMVKFLWNLSLKSVSLPFLRQLQFSESAAHVFPIWPNRFQ